MIVIPLIIDFTRKSVNEDKDYIYLFADNASRTSGKNVIRDGWYKEKYGKNRILMYPTMTQAVIRGLENAYPITTMFNEHRMQWQDHRFIEYKNIIDDEIEQIINNIKNNEYEGIKYSAKNPFGSGKISNMKDYSPLCWKYLNMKLKELKIDNGKDSGDNR